MAIFPSTASKRDSAAPETALSKQPDANEFSFVPVPVAASTAPRQAPREAKESVIAGELAIEGRIQGAGHVRIAGRFTGDIAVEGDLTIEAGARVNGSVRARRVVIAGELEGNIEAAERVEVIDSGSMAGDIKASTVTVAAGARMRGQVEFGWEAEVKTAVGKRSAESKADADIATATAA